MSTSGFSAGAPIYQPMGSEFRIETERLRLEPTGAEHAPQLFPLMSDSRITTYLAWEPHRAIEETAEVLGALAAAQARGVGYHWTVLASDQAIGLVSLIDVQRSHRSWRLDRAEVAYWIDPLRQGEGFATEATAAVITCAFSRLGLNRLRISHTSDNPASGRIPQKLGFRFFGCERQFFQKNGRWHDMNHYEMLAEEWNAADSKPR